MDNEETRARWAALVPMVSVELEAPPAPQDQREQPDATARTASPARRERWASPEPMAGRDRREHRGPADPLDRKDP